MGGGDTGVVSIGGVSLGGGTIGDVPPTQVPPGRGANGAAANDASPNGERVSSERDLALLRQEHRDLDAAINALERSGLPDQIQVQRLKKRKLTLRDRIGHLEDELTPDITA